MNTKYLVSPQVESIPDKQTQQAASVGALDLSPSTPTQILQGQRLLSSCLFEQQ